MPSVGSSTQSKPGFRKNLERTELGFRKNFKSIFKPLPVCWSGDHFWKSTAPTDLHDRCLDGQCKGFQRQYVYLCSKGCRTICCNNCRANFPKAMLKPEPYEQRVPALQQEPTIDRAATLKERQELLAAVERCSKTEEQDPFIVSNPEKLAKAAMEHRLLKEQEVDAKMVDAAKSLARMLRSTDKRLLQTSNVGIL